jgi:predicted nucleic acid-binding protein
MASVFVDTSVWVDYLRQGQSPASQELDLLLEEGRAVLCGMVELELLQGARPHDKTSLEELLSALPYVEISREDFQDAGEILGGLRAKGIQIPATDGLIAAVCIRQNLPLLTGDKHFDHIQSLKKHKPANHD